MWEKKGFKTAAAFLTLGLAAIIIIRWLWFFTIGFLAPPDTSVSSLFLSSVASALPDDYTGAFLYGLTLLAVLISWKIYRRRSRRHP